jgi:hypothetical protein
MRYRVLLFAVIGFVLAYSAYWLVLLNHMRYTVGVFIEARHQQGINITYDKISYAGFPYRFEIDLLNPVISRPAAAKPFKWTSPRLLVESLAWNPGHMVVLTETSKLEVDNTPLGHIEMNINGGKASIITAGAGNIKRASAVADTFSLTYSSSPDKVISASHSEVHLRTELDFPKEPESAEPKGPPLYGPPLYGPPLYGIAFSFADLRIAGLRANPFGDKITLLQAQLELRGMTEPARAAKQMAAWRDRGGVLEMPQFALQWGGFDAKASGTLALDKEMRPLASFVVKVKGWEPLPDYLREAKFIDRELSDDISATLGVIVQTSSIEDEGRVTIPIAVQDGRLFFGPLPLLRVPSIDPMLSHEDEPVAPQAPASALPPPLIWPGVAPKPPTAEAPLPLKAPLPPVAPPPVKPARG